MDDAPQMCQNHPKADDTAQYVLPFNIQTQYDPWSCWFLPLKDTKNRFSMGFIMSLRDFGWQELRTALTLRCGRSPTAVIFRVAPARHWRQPSHWQWKLDSSRGSMQWAKFLVAAMFFSLENTFEWHVLYFSMYTVCDFIYVYIITLLYMFVCSFVLSIWVFEIIWV